LSLHHDLDMFGYALKRLARGKALFLALFLSVALAATLFSGILQGADVVGSTMMGSALAATDVDFVSSAEDRNLTRTSLAEVEAEIKTLDRVDWVEHLIRSVEREERVGIEVWTAGLNDSMPFTIVAIAGDSRLVEGLIGVERLEPGRVYVDEGSVNASLFQAGESVTLQVPTYVPGGSLVDIESRYANYTVGGVVEIDDRLFSIAMGRYATFLNSLLIGSADMGRRPQHQLMFIAEETFLDWMNEIYGERRRHTRVLIAETVIGLERGGLLNTWNIAGSATEVNRVFDRVNSVGASLGYTPVNYLGELLEAIDGFSSNMKTSTLLVAAPVFFTAWYLGLTVSDISLGQRRREIGLLFTRGLNHRQVFYVFLIEALIVGILAGAAGIVAGALVVPLVMPGVGAASIFSAITPATLAASIAFNCALALMSVYMPARKALEVSVVDALSEFEGSGESGSWQEPVLAILLGGYRVAMLLLGLTVEQFRPTTAGNLVVFVLYSTWWGVDFILTYIAPVLIFWGVTKLLIQHLPFFHDVLDRLAGVLVGDISMFSSLSARRNARRAAASAFMTALILGYGVSVIGGVAQTDDFSDRFTRLTVGADASVWLFRWEEAEDLRERVAGLGGVESATVESWFQAESPLGTIQARVIEPEAWAETAYMEEGWMGEADAFERMGEAEDNIIMERGAADLLGITVGSKMVVRVDSKAYTFNVVGLFGREPGPGWAPQNPTIYVPDTFPIKEKNVQLRRILVRLGEGVDLDNFRADVEAISPDVERVDLAEEIIGRAATNIFLAGPRRIQELGVYFSALVSSLGVVLVVYTALRSRWKELTVMSIRGFTGGQLTSVLLVENMGLVLFSIALGLGVGAVMLRGETMMLNATMPSVIARHLVFPPSAQLTLAAVVGLIIACTVAPILLAVRHTSSNPVLRAHE
jgi:hypothetical protein